MIIVVSLIRVLVAGLALGAVNGQESTNILNCPSTEHKPHSDLLVQLVTVVAVRIALIPHEMRSVRMR